MHAYMCVTVCVCVCVCVRACVRVCDVYVFTCILPVHVSVFLYSLFLVPFLALKTVSTIQSKVQNFTSKPVQSPFPKIGIPELQNGHEGKLSLEALMLP